MLVSLNVVDSRRCIAVASSVCGGAVSVISALKTLTAVVASRPFLVAALILAQLKDQLTSVMRNDSIVIFQDDTFQLERPFPFLLQIPSLQGVLLARVVKRDDVETKRLSWNTFNQHEVGTHNVNFVAQGAVLFAFDDE